MAVPPGVLADSPWRSDFPRVRFTAGCRLARLSRVKSLGAASPSVHLQALERFPLCGEGRRHRWPASPSSGLRRRALR